MGKFKGTQGKWVKVNYPHCIAVETILENGQEHTVFTDQFCYASRFNGNAHANALLISKAPEMLEMLEECLSILGDVSLGTDMSEWVKSTKQLIKEATTI